MKAVSPAAQVTFPALIEARVVTSCDQETNAGSALSHIDKQADVSGSILFYFIIFWCSFKGLLVAIAI